MSDATSAVQNIQAVRNNVLRLNSELRTMGHLAIDGKLSLRDLQVLTRLMFGGSSSSEAVGALYTYLSVLSMAQTATRIFNLSLGPVGWAILGLSTAAAVGGAYYASSMSVNDSAQMG